HAFADRGETRCEIDRGGGLTHATLLVGDGDDFGRHAVIKGNQRAKFKVFGGHVWVAGRFRAARRAQSSGILSMDVRQSFVAYATKVRRNRFMVRKRDCEVAEALHEPPPHPIPLPLGGGEGARRAGEGVVHGPNACEKRKGAVHEPPLPRPSATLSPLACRS